MVATSALAEWVQRSGRCRDGDPAPGRLRFAFYGRVSTEDWQDPVTSRTRQREQAEALVRDHVATRADVGQLNHGRLPAGSARARIHAMPADLDANPAHAIGLCQAAHTRLLTTARQVTDEQVRSPSLLPGWTIGHVLTHLARNADGHTRRLEGALRGEDVPRYPGGTPQRDRDIDEGAPRPAADIFADLESSQRGLELAWERSAGGGLAESGAAPGRRCSARRAGSMRSRCTTLTSASATSPPTGPTTTLPGRCPGCWPPSRQGCAGAQMRARSSRGCWAGRRCRRRSSLNPGDGRGRGAHPMRSMTSTPAVDRYVAWSWVICRW